LIATATCPRCGHTNELVPCQNCGGTDFRRGPLNDGSSGMICNACDLGFSHIPCQSGCGTVIPAIAFGTSTSRMAGRARQGMNAYESGKCFIATELYGNDSIEVTILRRLRDKVLIKSYLGQAFVNTYYRVAPKVIPIMRRFVSVRLLLHVTVALVVFVVRSKPVVSGLLQRSGTCGRATAEPGASSGGLSARA
jgi:hypothetical protein